MKNNPFILLFQCKDQKGIVAAISNFILKSGGNILSADQYSTDPENGYFFFRAEFVVDRSEWTVQALSSVFSSVGAVFNAEWSIFDSRDRQSMGILASRPGHCLFELLYLWRSGELRCDIPFVISNCDDHRELVEQFKVPFFYVPATRDRRKEDELLSIIGETDFLVLARYMLTLSADFLASYDKDIINIHHGFLPSFRGAHPYRQAYGEGVKVIGATAHFVTEMLDEGPIISQKVEPVSHRDSVESLTRKGRNLEKSALASAVADYLDHRVIRFANKTIIFEKS